MKPLKPSRLRMPTNQLRASQLKQLLQTQSRQRGSLSLLNQPKATESAMPAA